MGKRAGGEAGWQAGRWVSGLAGGRENEQAGLKICGTRSAEEQPINTKFESTDANLRHPGNRGNDCMRTLLRVYCFN